MGHISVLFTYLLTRGQIKIGDVLSDPLMLTWLNRHGRRQIDPLVDLVSRRGRVSRTRTLWEKVRLVAVIPSVPREYLQVFAGPVGRKGATLCSMKKPDSLHPNHGQERLMCVGRVAKKGACRGTTRLVYLFIYLFKISDRRTRGPLILSEEHRNT